MTELRKIVDENVKRLETWSNETVATLTTLTNTSADTVKVPVEALENLKLLLVTQTKTMSALNAYVNQLNELAQTLPR